MRTKLIAIMAAVCFTATCFAKDIKIVVLNTDPQMHCANCESKIKNNIRFEKGIKEIETNLADKTVTIKYDADKTTVEKSTEKPTKEKSPLTQKAGFDFKGTNSVNIDDLV